jgi:hypothetical protein
MKDIFARCLKKNVAQVCTLFKMCAYRKEEFQLIPTFVASITGKPTTKFTVVTSLILYVNLLVTASILFCPFPCTKHAV